MTLKRLLVILALALPAAHAGSAEVLKWAPQRESDYDLAWDAGNPVSTHWIPWSSLRALETRVLEVNDEFVSGRQQIRLVFLSKLLEAAGGWGDDDLLVAFCKDGYAAYLPRDYVERRLPFLVLEIDGKGPETWPPAGLTFNPGPFVVSISDQVSPGVTAELDAPHKMPWGVVRILKTKSERYLAPFYSDAFSSLSAQQKAGRELWLNSCFSCHTGPVEGLGGNKSGRPFAVLQSLSAFGRDYVKAYVRNPKAMNPEAKMSPHPHYSDEQLDALLAFLSAGVAK